ncbi:hypothetical protein C3L33_01119, partial [Rhododendron williamsianum]
LKFPICRITFTPTIQHCSMATVIGLCLRVKLKECFPPHFKVDIKVAPGSHANEESGELRAISIAFVANPYLFIEVLKLSETIHFMHTLSKIKGCLEFSSTIAWSSGDYMGTVSAVNVVELLKVMKQKKQVESFVNKQLNDKERVAAALENPNLRQLVDECLYSNEL